MSVKKHIPRFCKFYSFCEEIPEEVLDGTVVDSYFYRNIFDISQSQHRIVRVRKSSNKKSFAFKLFQFCDLEIQLRYVVQDVVTMTKGELSSLIDTLRDFLKTFDKASKCLQIPLPKHESEIGSTTPNDNLFCQNYNDIIEHSNRQIPLSFPF